MTLRVSKYSWPAPPTFPSGSNSTHASTSRLPTIHVEGEMAGIDQEVIRYLKGTVSMIGDGAVRWSLVCSLSPHFPRFLFFFFFFAMISY